MKLLGVLFIIFDKIFNITMLSAITFLKLSRIAHISTETKNHEQTNTGGKFLNLSNFRCL